MQSKTYQTKIIGETPKNLVLNILVNLIHMAFEKGTSVRDVICMQQVYIFIGNSSIEADVTPRKFDLPLEITEEMEGILLDGYTRFNIDLLFIFPPSFGDLNEKENLRKMEREIKVQLYNLTTDNLEIEKQSSTSIIYTMRSHEDNNYMLRIFINNTTEQYKVH